MVWECSLNIVRDNWAVSIHAIVLVLVSNGNARSTVVAVMLVQSFTSVEVVDKAEEESRDAAETKHNPTNDEIDKFHVDLFPFFLGKIPAHFTHFILFMSDMRQSFGFAITPALLRNLMIFITSISSPEPTFMPA